MSSFVPNNYNGNINNLVYSFKFCYLDRIEVTLLNYKILFADFFLVGRFSRITMYEKVVKYG